MKKWVGFLATLGAVTAFTARADAPTVTPTSGGIGQNVSLTSIGFAPVKAPRVMLVPHPSQTARKTVSMKYVGFAAATGAIDAQVVSGVAGTYDVQVVPTDKHVDRVTLPGPFTILVPAPNSVDPSTGASNVVVAIDGSLFGDARGKVTIGGRASKVKDWADGEIHVIVPKNLKIGAQPVVVTNKAGRSTAAVAYVVKPGGKYFIYDIEYEGGGSYHFETTKEQLFFFGASYDPTQDFFTIGASQKPKGLPHFNFTVYHPSLTTSMPYDIVMQAGATGTLSGQFNPSAAVSYQPEVTSNFKVTITGYSGGVLEGTFSGDLTKVSTTPTKATVLNGQFRADLVIVNH